MRRGDAVLPTRRFGSPCRAENQDWLRASMGRHFKLVMALVIGLLCVSVGARPASAQWSNGYNYRRTITINYTQVSASNQSNFPVFVSGTFSDMVPAIYGGNVASPNGYDITFTSDAGGTSPLAFERQSYNQATGAIQYWVKVPTVSHTANTVFYMFYGNSAITSDQSTPSAVWSSYQGVWHLTGGTDEMTWTDSTSNENEGAGDGPNIVLGSSTGGQTGGYVDLDGGGYLDLGTSSVLQPAGAMSASGWIKTSSEPEFAQIISDASNGTSGYNLYLTNYHYPAFILDVGGWNSCYAYSTTSVTDGNWHYIVGTYSGPGGTASIYIDGTLAASGTCSNTTTTYGSPSIGEIGQKAGNSSSTEFGGYIGEVRVSGAALSAGWVRTEYNNQSSPSTFYSVGAATQSGSGSVPTITDWSPTSGPVGTTVTLTGTNFGSTPGTSTVMFGSVGATPISWSSTSITVAVPSGAATSNIVVNVGGTNSNGAQFTVVSPQWSNGYSHSRTITINYTQVSNSDQTNFPVLFTGTYADLATTSNGGYVTNTNGYDITFTSDAAGTMPLPFEQESYNASTGAVTYWVQIPTVSHTTNTVFYIFYGNPNVATNQSNKTAVWQYNYQGVWHLGNGTNLDVYDSTSNGIDGAPNSVTATTGKISGGGSFDGSSQYLDLGSDTDDASAATGYPLQIEGTMTASAWVKPATSQVEFPQILAEGDSSGVTGYNLFLENYHYPAFIIDANTWGGCFAESSTSITDNNWHYVVGTYAGGDGTISVYVDGALKASSTCPASPTLYGTSPQGEIGRKLSSSEGSVYFNGVIDEVRLATTALSAGWIATEYNNQNSPSSFYSVSSATAASAPSLSTVSPSSGPTGSEVVITGSNFGEAQGASVVTFNGTFGIPTAWSATSITVPVPPRGDDWKRHCDHDQRRKRWSWFYSDSESCDLDSIADSRIGRHLGHDIRNRFRLIRHRHVQRDHGEHQFLEQQQHSHFRADWGKHRKCRSNGFEHPQQWRQLYRYFGSGHHRLVTRLRRNR